MSSRRRRGTSTSLAPAGGQDPKRMRPGVVGAGASEPLCTPEGRRSEVLPGGGAEKGSSSAPAMVVSDLMVDEHVLECKVCFLPLKPPIFQCAVGHVLCSPCSEKFKDAGKCHLCGVAMPAGYQRCHAMEDMMNSIRGPCPHAPYGCDATPVYHACEEHILDCPHALCHCPGDDCSFVGSVTTLVEHLKAAHNFPFTAEACAGCPFTVSLRDGFNFITAVRGDTQYLLLLNMASTPFGHAISVVRIRSLATMARACNSSAPATKNTTCNLELYYYQDKHVQPDEQHFLRSDQTSRFQVECRCPSNGLPDPNASFQFFIPKCIGGSYEATLICATIISVGSS